MRLLSLLAVPFLAAVLAFPASMAARAGVLITIDKKAQAMSVWVDGIEQYNWPVSTGRPGYATPSGSYKPFRMEPEHYSKEWDDAPMPHSIFFTPIGHAIHGSYEVNNLGKTVSHGCVRLAPENAATLYELVEAQGMANTEVVVSGGDSGVAQGVKPRQRQARPPGDDYADDYYARAYPYAWRRGRMWQPYDYEPRPRRGWFGGPGY
jgi:L,D-transpeptidase catalytic domain